MHVFASGYGAGGIADDLVVAAHRMAAGEITQRHFVSGRYQPPRRGAPRQCCPPQQLMAGNGHIVLLMQQKHRIHGKPPSVGPSTVDDLCGPGGERRFITGQVNRQSGNFIGAP